MQLPVKNLQRIGLAAVCLAPGFFAGCGAGRADGTRDTIEGGRMLVIGFDGMEPKILGPMMDAGLMPNFTRVANEGVFTPLATSMPPQSPVAWSNFISGSHPGTHQIYDFIHRDPNPPAPADPDHPAPAVNPYLSTSRVEPGDPLPWYAAWLPDPIPWFGDYQIPLTGSKIEQLRRGGDFWTPLVESGVKTAIWRVPANYPPPTIDGHVCLCALSGMGTPDIFGSYGEFTHFTQNVNPRGRRVGGGRFVFLPVRRNRAVVELEGPANFLKAPGEAGKEPAAMQIEMEVVRDAEADVVTITIQDQTLLLQKGEWSDWITIEFDTGVPQGWLLNAMTLPTGVKAVLRFYVKEVHPRMEIYATPLNIDPKDPVNPISTPADFATDLAEACGDYYTTGIPEDTKALENGALNEDEFLAQCRNLLDERIRQYRYALEHFDRGFMFYYFGSTDQLAHIFWRDRDPGHPGLKPGEREKYGHILEDLYVEMDGLVGEALERLGPDDTIILMSDHGFASFRRGFNLNTWLVNEGYATLKDPSLQADVGLLGNADWTRTQAYGLGINGLYLNLQGREKEGCVPPGRKQALLHEIGDKLLAVRDADGTPVIEKVYYVEEIYPGADPHVAPDLLVGYALNYRGSWETALGDTPLELITDNLKRWSGDHCIADHLVPGILVTNRKITVSDPSLSDMAPTILSTFGLEVPEEMHGRPILVPRK